MRTEAELVGETDAEIWAEEFFARFDGDQIASVDGRGGVGEDTMATWFANAIMAGFDEGVRKAESAAIERIGVFSSILATMTGAWDGKAPDWMPEPPDFLTLWEASGVLTAPDEHPVFRDRAEAAERIVAILDPRGENEALQVWLRGLRAKAESVGEGAVISKVE